MLASGDIRDWQERALPALLFVGSAAAGLTPVADGDVYWHLAAGREMVHSGALLRSDPFSVSAAGHAWFDVHWLFQLALFALHRSAGLPALVLAKCLLIGSGALCLYAALERAARPLFVAFAIAALFAARHLLLMRPVIVTLLFLGLFFWRLERFRNADATKLWWVELPLAQVVWTNCQGLFALGPALVGAYAAGAWAQRLLGQRSWFPFAQESRSNDNARAHCRALSLTWLLCLLGSLATPYGWRAVALPIELLLRLTPRADNPYQSVAENLPPFLLARFSPEQFWHLPWFLGLLALSFVLAKRRSRLSHLLVLAGCLGLGLISNRNVLLLYWMATPIAALQLAPWAQRAWLALQRRRGASVVRWLPHLVLASLLGAVGTAAARESSLREPAPFHIPVSSVAVLERLPGGSIFSADHQGGYLIWKLYPRFKPYIDTRLVLRSPEQYNEYLELAEHPERFDAFQRRHGFSYVVLPVVYPDRYLALIAHLYDSPHWKLIYTDGADVVFAQSSLPAAAVAARVDLRDSATTERILRELDARFGAAPRVLESARIQLATLEIATRAFPQAERILSETDAPAARALQARARLLAGDLEGAEAIAERSLRQDDADVRSLDVMAMLYVRRGRLPTALTFLRRALAVDPFDGEATTLLGTLEEKQHEP